MQSLILPSPAKLNLYLKVLRRLPNGYHELVTLFHRISLCDTLRIQRAKKGFFLSCSDPSLDCGENNLITRAYRALQDMRPDLDGVKVHLTKRIPIGGGLGGGSGNAATFLLGMNRFFKLCIPLKKLIQAGAKLGADVPFFLYERPFALGTRYGDRICPLPIRTKLYFVLILDPKPLNTKQVYQTLVPGKSVSLTKARGVVKILATFLKRKAYLKAAGLFENDLEIPAWKLRPAIQKTIDSIQSLDIEIVRMSGSGPTVFAVVSSAEKAQKVARWIRQKWPDRKVVVAHSL